MWLLNWITNWSESAISFPIQTFMIIGQARSVKLSARPVPAQLDRFRTAHWRWMFAICRRWDLSHIMVYAGINYSCSLHLRGVARSSLCCDHCALRCYSVLWISHQQEVHRHVVCTLLRPFSLSPMPPSGYLRTDVLTPSSSTLILQQSRVVAHVQQFRMDMDAKSLSRLRIREQLRVQSFSPLLCSLSPELAVWGEVIHEE